MKLFIDANIYLDFYRSTNEAIKVFDELIKSASSLVLTDQIIDEFYRNREVVLREIRSKFQADSQVESFSSSFLKDLKEFSELNTIRDQYKNKKKEIDCIIAKIIEDPSIDPIVNHFENLIRTKGVAVLKTTNETMIKAHRRKLMGNPPVSDKYSIGDEINWELLLNLKEDIVIVARDNTFKRNINFLKSDFNRTTKKSLLLLTDRITLAIEKVGNQTSQELKAIEEKQIKELKTFGNRWMVTSVDGNIANVTDGRFSGYTVIDTKDVDPSFRCGNCGNYGPWNGVRCLSCGMMSDD